MNATDAIGVLRRWWHRLVHRFGMARGYVETYERDGHWYVAHVCMTCSAPTHEQHLFTCGCAPWVGEVKP